MSSIPPQVQLEAYNLFATAATDNVVSLWDLRAPSVVFRYSGHVNRRELITIALSPCLRYLATGSEDRSARIVDVRGGKELVKIQGHRDVVSGVAFNPLFPQLATCSFDGTVKFYVDPTASNKPMPGL
jgi:WD40 repeat protein